MSDYGKGDNAGAGLSTDLFTAIIGDLTGAGAKGKVEEQAAALLEIAREEHAALHPGNGNANVAEAVVKYIAIVQAEAELAAVPSGPSPQATAAIAKLSKAIKGLGKLWTDYGPVTGGFLDVKTKP
jgi:hypothetical protein